MDKLNKQLFIEAKSGFHKNVKALLEKGGDADYIDPATGAPLIVQAASNRYIEVVNEILAHNSNVNAADREGNTALMKVVVDTMFSRIYEVQKKLIFILLNAGADPYITNQHGESALTIAEANRAEYADIIENFMSKKTRDLNEQLLLAARNGRTAKLQKLLLMGADVNAIATKDYDKFLVEDMTPLMIAASRGHLKTMEILLNAGADVNFKVENSFSALTVAGFYERKECEQLLLDSGADIHYKGIPEKVIKEMKAAQEKERKSNHIAPNETHRADMI